MPLPFLRLPSLVKEQVVHDLNNRDFFHFSTISSKSKDIAKSANREIDLLTWDFEEKADYRIKLESQHEKPTRLLPANCRREASDAEIKQAETMTNQIVAVFNVKEFYMFGDLFDRKDFVSKFTKKQKWYTIKDNDINAPQTAVILAMFSFENLKLSHFFKRLTPLELNGPMNARFLTCHDVSWFPIGPSWHLECEELSVEGLEATQDDLKTVLQTWIDGKFKSLKKVTMMALSMEKKLLKVSKQFKIKKISENTFRLQREDGATATVVVEDNLIMTPDN